MKRESCLYAFSRYASLNVLGMLGLSCYILADTFFVAKGLGSNGLAALNLAIPVYGLMHGSGLMLGIGGATRYAIHTSQGSPKQGNAAFTHALLLGAALSVIFVTAGAFFADPLTTFLGADTATFEMCKTYLQVLLLFAPLFILNNIMLGFIRNDGAPQLCMFAMIGGSLSNVVLDYLFIFPMNMGIFGAVFATGLAPGISLLILSPFLLKKRNHFKPAKCRLLPRLFGKICLSGIPSLVTELSSGIVMFVFNTILLGLHGTTGVAAYGIIANLSLVVLAIYTGIAQGIQPLVSRYYGAKSLDSVRKTCRYAVLAVAFISAAIYIGVFFGADSIAAIFNSEQNPVLQKIAVDGLKIYFTGCVFAGFNIVLSSYFAATDCVKQASGVSLLRGFFLIIPLAFGLSALWNITGLWSAFPVTELLAAMIGLLLYLRQEGRAKAGARPRALR